MGNVKVPYYSVRKGRGFWLSTKRMQAMGFPSSVPCGPDGPDAWRIAQEGNARWQVARTGREPAPKHVWPRGSLGEAFDRFRTTETWKTDKAYRTREDNRNPKPLNLLLEHHFNPFIEALILQDNGPAYLDELRAAAIAEHRPLYVRPDGLQCPYGWYGRAWTRHAGTGGHIARTMINVWIGMEC